jgi:hypothetical protein
VTAAPALRFNPRARLRRVDFDGGASCLVLDEALQDPVALRDFAIAARARFVPAPFNAYPGIEMPMPLAASAVVEDYFNRQVRALLGGRRTLRMNTRLAMVTTEPARLEHDSSTLDTAGFDAKYPEIARDYLQDPNAWFERIGRVDAAFNRMIFYDGRLFHSGEVAPPPARSGDPSTGRLTLNGFFTCSRPAR